MAQQPTSDPVILARLNELGPYDFQQPSLLWRWVGTPGEIQWAVPVGFQNDLAPIAIALAFHVRRAATNDDLRRLLDAVAEFRADLPRHIGALRSYLLECFRECYADQLEPHDRERLAGPGDSIGDVSILSDVASIDLRFDATGPAFVRTAWLAVGWDEEHGLDAEWSASGDLTRPWRNA